MANQQRLKRRIIRQVVQENLDTMEGKSAAAPRAFRASTAGDSARSLFFVSLPAALFASTYVISSATDEWRRSTDTSSTQRFVSSPQATS